MPSDEIVRAFKEGEDWYIHLYTLTSGFKHHHVQVVKHVGSGELRIRKVTHHRRKMGFRQSPANRHFEQDLRTGKLIDQFYDPEVHKARFARLLSESTIPPDVLTEDCKYTQVSYWTFCNGVTPSGGLKAFIHNCTTHRVPLPDGLIIRFAWNLLESLLFLYTMEGCARIRLRGPANLSDFALHFRPGSSLPDLYVADFGDSYCISHEGSMGEPLTWDISRVMFLIVALYLRSEVFRANVPIGTTSDDMHRLLVERGQQPNPPKIASLYVALDRLDARFCQGEIGFAPLGNTSRAAFPTPESYSLVPYLQAVTRLAEANAMVNGSQRDELWRRETGYNLWQQWLESEDRGVSTFDSVHEAKTQSRPCRGPFYLATVDPVTKTLIDVDESRTYHLPNMENVEEDTDLDDDDEGNVLDNELID